MKVRILANTLRFRLKQPEVNQFHEQGKLTEVTAFGPDPASQLRFVLEVSPEADFAVRFEANTATVMVPRQVAEEWANTDRVGFEAKVDVGNGEMLELLVEKDFACLDRPEEDNVGTYPNPNAFC